MNSNTIVILAGVAIAVLAILFVATAGAQSRSHLGHEPAS